MEIKKGNFKFRGSLTPLDLNKVNSIALHHPAHLTWDENDIHAFHLTRTTNGQQWLGIGYNYFVRFDGTVVECRGLNQGAAVEGQNGHIISLAFQGEYDTMKEMPEAQFKAGVWLIEYLKKLLGKDLVVDGHNRWNPTTCPGKFFPLVRMISEKFVEIMAPPKTEVAGISFSDVKVGIKESESSEVKEVMFGDTKPINIGGRVMVSVRAVVESLGHKVDWDSKNNMVVITKAP